MKSKHGPLTTYKNDLRLKIRRLRKREDRWTRHLIAHPNSVKGKHQWEVAYSARWELQKALSNFNGIFYCTGRKIVDW